MLLLANLKQKRSVSYRLSASEAAFRSNEHMEVPWPEGTVDLNASGYQFLACTALETVVIKEGITAIPKNCFYNCNNLSSINIPSTVTSIGSSAFTWCESLESLVLPLPLKGTFNEIDCFKHTPAYNNGKITYA